MIIDFDMFFSQSRRDVMLSQKNNDIPSGLFSGFPEDYNHSIPLGL